MGKATIGLAGASFDRNYFEGDTLFRSENIEVILQGYKEACFKLRAASKLAVRSGKLSHMREAQWYEAAAQTFECILSAIPHSIDNGASFSGDEELDIPVPPIFD